jgi:hypothetical protein
VAPKVGDFVGVNVVVSLGDDVLLNSKAPGNRPIAFTFGKPPYGAPICLGVAQVRMCVYRVPIQKKSHLCLRAEQQRGCGVV